MIWHLIKPEPRNLLSYCNQNSHQNREMKKRFKMAFKRNLPHFQESIEYFVRITMSYHRRNSNLVYHLNLEFADAIVDPDKMNAVYVVAVSMHTFPSKQISIDIRHTHTITNYENTLREVDAKFMTDDHLICNKLMNECGWKYTKMFFEHTNTYI